ncbi:MAG: tetratricopeptide repeat protein, partial [Magnetospirillum sp.]
CRTLRTQPDFEDAYANLGIALYDLGQLEEAAASYRQALDLRPDNPKTNSNLGSILRDLGRLDEAEAICRRAVEIMPDFAEAHYNLGIVLADLSRGPEAEASYRRAVEIMPHYAEAHNNLGNTLRDLGRLEEAAAIYRRAVEIMPDFAEVHSNLGNTLRDLGKLGEAEASCRRALEIKPDYAEAHIKLGNTLYDLGQLEEAVACYRRALETKPDCAEAHNNLGIALLDLGRSNEALKSCLSALRMNQTWSSRTLFVRCVRRLRLIHDDNDVRAALARALSEPWGRPNDLIPAATSLVKLAPEVGACIGRSNKAWPQRLPARDLFTAAGSAAVSADALLHALLVSAPIWDIELERFLTMARHAMLVAATGTAANDDGEANLLAFHCALAQQCFINEYVFDRTDIESRQAMALRDALIAALAADGPVPVHWLPAVAAYLPLNSLPLSDRLLDRPWPEVVTTLLSQQISEPKQEGEYRTTISRLTAVEDDVSLLVQRQYEENPYPRWIKAAPVDQPKAIDTVLRRILPSASFKPLGKVEGLDVLIAGCGTGQQSIDGAQLYMGARVLAVDLSLASLCYAKRKTTALGLDAIAYGQADIMSLGSLGRSFDVIEASGVLHHLADPMAGWRVLLGLLRPGGIMRLGLYSDVARRDVVRGRAFIAERGYEATADDIRRCRQDLMAAGGGA